MFVHAGGIPNPISMKNVTTSSIETLAADHGLILRGGFRIEDGDEICIPGTGTSAALMLLFGQAGSAIWPGFSRSAEYTDGNAHPMDRWSRRIGTSLAAHLGGHALFPFEGPPWHPFSQWATRAEGLRPSPLGILMHPQFGLWHAYRFAIALPEPVAGFETGDQRDSNGVARQHACDDCASKPCLSSCPVDAFRDGRYDIAACAAYLTENEQAHCLQVGCLARAACPEGKAFVYDPAHRRFHMHEFHTAVSQRQD